MGQRLALGTAQFGLRYGIANVTGKVGEASGLQILERAKEGGLNTLDTAIAYGDSEACLGRLGIDDWRVITKLPPLPESVRDVALWVRTNVFGSLSRLRTRRLEAVLLHRSIDLLGPHRKKYIGALEEVKREGLTGAIGVSVYNPSELVQVVDDWSPDLVQAPFNVLDRRLMTSGWLERLRSMNIRVHVRSIFLQGLLLMPSERRPAAFSRWAPVLDAWLGWCRQERIAPLEAAVRFALAHPEFERIIVGVDSLPQMEQLLAACGSGELVPPDRICSEDLELIEPSRWVLS